MIAKEHQLQHFFMMMNGLYKSIVTRLLSLHVFFGHSYYTYHVILHDLKVSSNCVSVTEEIWP